MDSKHFKLNDNENKACDEFMSNLSNKYKKMPVSLIFSRGSGIGITTTISVGDKSKDITDYGNW